MSRRSRAAKTRREQARREACPTPAKAWYPTQGPQRAYLCPCQRWHLTARRATEPSW